MTIENKKENTNQRLNETRIQESQMEPKTCYP